MSYTPTKEDKIRLLEFDLSQLQSSKAIKILTRRRLMQLVQNKLQELKPDQEKVLYERLVYMNIEEILFGAWLGENGWQPYDGNDRWINLALLNKVESIVNLFAEYKKTVKE